MKQFAVVFGLSLFGVLTWRVASSLSSDALGMAVGLLFGVLAGIPTALLVLASQRHQPRRPLDDDDNYDGTAQTVNNFYVVTNNTTNDNRQLIINTGAQGMPLIADRQREIQEQTSGRVFRVVGERQEWDGGA